MPKRSNEFQKLVALINGCLRDSGHVEESGLLVDKTTRLEREVDILISGTFADYPINISIEVTDRTRKAGTPWVEEMRAKHSDLPTDKLVLVSRRGFSRSALEKAKFHGIEAITFEEASETDWDLATRLTSSGFLAITTIEYKYSSVCDHPDGKKVFSPAKRNTKVYLPYRDIPTDFDMMAQFFLFEPKIKDILQKQIEDTIDRIFTLDYTPQSGTYVISQDGTEMALLNLSIEIEAKHTTTPMNFAVGRYGKRDVAIGTSSDPGTQLYYAIVRKEGDRVEGLLLDELGIRRLAHS
jgi:hypothetical protein